MAEQEIIRVLEKAGPLTGAELQERMRMEIRELWAACRNADGIRMQIAGTRFLRLDRTVEGFARLSPSIRREFQTYTVLGVDDQSDEISRKAGQLKREVQEISRAKLQLARETMEEVVDTMSDPDVIRDKTCFIIAGDITYGMAHAVPRPESSTGEMVRGSDLDIIAVTDDDLSMDRVKALDEVIYKKKHFLLVHPDYREEVDYLIKNMAKVRKQVAFDTFEHMVACKILHEGELLHGSARVFEGIKKLIAEKGIPGKLQAMEKQAKASRTRAEAILLNPPASLTDRDVLTLFYTREESEEIY